MTTKTKALKLLQESRAQLAYLGDDKHTNELVSQIDAVLAQPEQETCKGCNGNGMVGNILDTVVCPFCKGSGVEAQPEQRSVSEHLKELRSDEPVAYLVYDHGAESQYLAFDDELGDMDGCEVTPLYTTPPQRKEPEQKPVAMRYDFDGYGWKYIDSGSGSDWQTRIKDAEPLYTTPPQRKPLTDEHPLMVFAKECALGAYQERELADAANKAIALADAENRAIEAAHGIKD